MIKIQFAAIRGKRITLLLLMLLACSSMNSTYVVKESNPDLQYTVSMPEASTHHYHVELYCNGWIKDTIDFKMARWTPGYYQIMDYARDVKNFSAKDAKDKTLLVNKTNGNTWQIIVNKNKPFILSYDVKADRKFVASNFLDSTHGYIVPAGLFLYINKYLNTPVSVKLIVDKQWSKTATGLDPVAGTTNEFTAPDFDILFDCPILIGNLEELPSFRINGIEHRFIAYEPGSFDRDEFINNLKKVVQAGVDVIGDIPYKQYTFIGIGPGRGGIEHLNNTTVSFNGNGLNNKESLIGMMNFLAHEYFHNFNVKRIRPYELGPFDYDKENRTNLLWISEGLTVYYEYLIVKRAGLITEQNLFANFERSINASENNPGRFYQSLTQASYNTWSDGPFGKQGKDANKSISYYDKGPAIGLILDFAIRHATKNKKSLDDVMRLLYRQYYKQQQRGFTDAEFQQACEMVAGISLNPEFEYICTTKEIDYSTYLAYAGLKIGVVTDTDNGNRKITISKLDKLDSTQYNILQSWLGN
jgi:predicted metalloprotease with PDZ domain